MCIRCTQGVNESRGEPDTWSLSRLRRALVLEVQADLPRPHDQCGQGAQGSQRCLRPHSRSAVHRLLALVTKQHDLGQDKVMLRASLGFFGVGVGEWLALWSREDLSPKATGEDYCFFKELPRASCGTQYPHLLGATLESSEMPWF